jgi:helix-turn-helix protein
MTSEEMVADGCVGIAEAQSFTGVKRTTLYALMGAGRLPFIKLNGRRLVPRRALVSLLASGLANAGLGELSHPTRTEVELTRRRGTPSA